MPKMIFSANLPPKPKPPAPKPAPKGEVRMGGKGPIQRVEPRKGLDVISYKKRNQYT